MVTASNTQDPIADNTIHCRRRGHPGAGVVSAVSVSARTSRRLPAAFALIHAVTAHNTAKTPYNADHPYDCNRLASHGSTTTGYDSKASSELDHSSNSGKTKSVRFA